MEMHEIQCGENWKTALLWDLFNEVERNEKTFVNGRYFEPMVFKKGGYQANQNRSCKTARTNHRVMFVANSYLNIDKQENCPGRAADESNPEVHPPRTLMQTQYMLASTEVRDAKQVFGLLKNRPEILVVPQLWAVFIDHGKLCSNRAM